MMMCMSRMMMMMMMMMHALRSFSENPIITGPLVCHLGEDATVVYDGDFAAHKQKVTPARVLFLMEQSRSRPITVQEKRIIVQNFAHFQQFSRLAAKGNSLGAKLHVCCATGTTSLNIGPRVVPHEPGLKLVCGHRPLILFLDVQVYRTTRPPQGWTPG